jgi:putative membrane protein
MLITGLVFAGIAALIHVYIFVLESLLWTGARARAIFGLRTAEEAQLTRPLAFNQGFYNLFLAIITAAGIAFFARDAEIGATLVFVGTGSMVAAGLVLLLSSPSKARSALIQLGPPLVAVVLVILALTL